MTDLEKQKVQIDEAIANGKFSELLREWGIPSGDALVVHTGEAPKSSAQAFKECVRCKHARSVESPNSYDSPSGVQISCSRGCSDYCDATCKRFHDPKEKKCMVRRSLQRYGLEPQLLADVSSSRANKSELLNQESNLLEVSADMRQSIRDSMDDESLLSIDQAQSSSELETVSLCFSQCANTCVEGCIADWMGRSARTQKNVDFDEKQTVTSLQPLPQGSMLPSV